MKKRFLNLFLVMLLIISVLPMVASAAEVECEHDYSQVVRIFREPTCTRNGVGIFECTLCGEKTFLTIPAAHTPEEVSSAVAPTCTSTGLTAGEECSVCGVTTQEQEVVPALGHDYELEKSVKLPTCTEKGLDRYRCTRCSSAKFEYPAALGHTPVDVAEVPATCVDAGTAAGKKCSVCDAVLEGLTEIAPTGKHEYVFEAHVSLPTCTESGTDRERCKNCDASRLSYPAALGHTPVDVAEVPATCVKAGTAAGKKCSVCDEQLSGFEEIPATGKHEYAFEAHVSLPTCTKSGTDRERCKNCDASRLSYPAALGHTPVDVAEVPATCVDAGTAAGKKCSVCDEQLSGFEEIPATGVHTWENKGYREGDEPTCSETGISILECTVCAERTAQTAPVVECVGATVEKVEPTCLAAGREAGEACIWCGKELSGFAEIPALGHDIVLMETYEAATCLVSGSGKYGCTRCGYRYDGSIDALGHDMQIVDVYRESSCTQAGCIKSKCANEGCGLVTIEETEALGHTEEILAAVPATCTATGLGEGKKCSVCDAIVMEQEVLPMLEHTWQEIEAKEATCTEDGHTAYKQCEVCETTQNKEIIKGGHQFENFKCTVCGARDTACEHENAEITITNATCTATGSKNFQCPDCGYEFVETIPMIAHVELDKSVAATCTAKGLKHVVCSVCNQDLVKEEIPVIDHTNVQGSCSACGASLCDHSQTTTEKHASTCTVRGYVIETCTSCGKVTTTELPLAAHNYVNGICSVCGSIDKNRLTSDYQDIFVVG